MIPTDLPLPHSSSTHGMSRTEKEDLAEQWYAMMIKNEDGEQDVQSTLSTLTPSISVHSSKDDLQEQRDPNPNGNRSRYHPQYQSQRDPDGGRLLEKHHISNELYPYKKGISSSPYNDATKAKSDTPNSKTDFLDGIIKSLSELSKTDSKARRSIDGKKSILQENKNGWSIQDSHRRMQERALRESYEPPSEQQQQQEEQRYPQSDTDYERQRSPDPYESRSLPPFRRGRSRDDRMARERSASRHSQGYMFGDRTSSSSSKYDAYSSETYSSRSETHSSRSGGTSNKSQRSSRTTPANMTNESASYSFRKARSWNIDRSLRTKSLFDAQPTSPESAATPDDPSHDFVERQDSRLSDKYSAGTEPMNNLKPKNLNSSTSKDAGRILQHFTVCGGPSDGPGGSSSVNHRDGGNTFESVMDFLDNPTRRSSPRTPTKNSHGEAHPSRLRTESFGNRGDSSDGGDRRSSSKARRSYEILPDVDDQQPLPKTSSQKQHEREILRDCYDGRDGPELMKRRSSSKGRSKSNGRPRHSMPSWQRAAASVAPPAPQDESRSDDFESIWEKADNPREAPPSQPRMSAGGASDFGSNIGSIAASVMSGGRVKASSSYSSSNAVLHQLTSCNAPSGQELSPSSSRDSASSPSAFAMLEKIQRKFNPSNSEPNADSSGDATDNENKNNDKSADPDQRIQEKLDAVRARSLRNAQNFLQKEKGDKKSTTGSKAQQTVGDFSFAGIDDENTDHNSIKVSEGGSSSKSSIKGKRLFNNNTPDPAKGSEKRTPASSGAKSAGVAAQKTPHTNEISHYMYVGYSQFGEDARKVLKLCGHHTIPTPDRRKGEILIRINVSTVSPADCAIRRGEWKNMTMDPYIIPGVALVGKVMGREKKKPRPSSSNIEPGDNVLALVKTGANARYICLQKNGLIKIPPKLNPERVVCLAETYLTAFQALHMGQRGGMRYRDNCLQGQSILIMDAYTPVGKAIIELARLGGAGICYGLICDDDAEDTSGGRSGTPSTNIHQRYKAVEQWGGIPLSTDPQEWLTLIGRQIDIFVTTYDPSKGDKGNGKITADHWKALKKDGQVHAICSHPGMSELEQRNLIIGAQSSNKANDLKPFRLPSCRPGGKEKMADRAVFYNLFDSWEGDRASKATARKDLEHLIKLLEANLIHPQIVERLPLSKIAKAQRSLEHHKITGEGHLICSPWLRDKPKDQPRSQTKRPQPNDTTKYVL